MHVQNSCPMALQMKWFIIIVVTNSLHGIFGPHVWSKLWYACLVSFQILSSLRNVRNNFMSLTNAKKEK